MSERFDDPRDKFYEVAKIARACIERPEWGAHADTKFFVLVKEVAEEASVYFGGLVAFLETVHDERLSDAEVGAALRRVREFVP